MLVFVCFVFSPVVFCLFVCVCVLVFVCFVFSPVLCVCVCGCVSFFVFVFLWSLLVGLERETERKSQDRCVNVVFCVFPRFVCVCVGV